MQDYRYATGVLLCPINTINVLFTTLLHWTSAHGQNMAISTTLSYIAIMFYIITIVSGIPYMAKIWCNFWFVPAEVSVSTIATCASSHLEWASTVIKAYSTIGISSICPIGITILQTKYIANWLLKV